MITLDRLLAEWLPEQRWFAAKGREITNVTPTLVAVLAEPDPRLEVRLVGVSFSDGGHESYVVPLSVRGEHAESLRHALLGQLSDIDGPAWVYDGMQDRELTPAGRS